MIVAALCLAAGALQVSLPVDRFSLRWQHSIEKTEWTEDYALVGNRLYLSEARIAGSGAGMDPPAGAVLSHGEWHYHLAQPWRDEIVLARSEFVPDYELCLAGRCQRLSHWIPIAAGPTTLRACPQSPP